MAQTANRSLIGALALCAAAGAQAVEVGQTAPSFELASLAGESVSLDAHAGKVRLVNFWASWCEPCRHELPALNALREEYKEQGFEIIGISVDSEPDNAKAFIEQRPVNYPVVLDEDFKTAKQYAAQAMPMSYIVDRDGKVQAVFAGFSQKKLSSITAAVEATLTNGGQE